MHPDNQQKQTRESVVKEIAESRLVAIVRVGLQSEVADVVRCLVEGGVTVLEITSNTPGFSQEIRAARARYPDVLIGAGTILDGELASEAIEAGAQFLVTPHTDKEIVAYAHANQLPVLMGALTPTEVVEASKAGADFIKVFPAGAAGLKHFKDLQGPFSGLPFMPVGGVNVDNVAQWFEAGAIGVGVGNDLTQAIHTDDEYQQRLALVKTYLEKIQQAGTLND